MKYRLGKVEYDSLTIATHDAVTVRAVTGKTWLVEVLFEGKWMCLADAVAIQAKRYPHIAEMAASA